MKKYISNKEIIIGGNPQIVFSPEAGRFSYVARSENEQRRIEALSYFTAGKIWKEEQPAPPKRVTEREAAKAKAEENKARNITVVDKVTNCADARLFLLEKCGIDKGLRSKADIKEAALQNGYEFTNL